MKHKLIFLICTVLCLSKLAQARGYPVGISSLEESTVALHPTSFVSSEARWDNINNTSLYPMFGATPTVVQNNNGEPFSIRFNGSQCLGNDLNSSRSIPAATELTFFVVFTAPTLGTHTIFAQQSSPTEGYVVTTSRDQDNVYFALYINGEMFQRQSRPVVLFPVGERMLAFFMFQQNYFAMQILNGGMAGGISVPTPVFSVAERKTLVGCNIEGENFANLDIHELIVVPRLLSAVEERLVYIILIARHGFTFDYNPSFDNEEFNTDVTGIYYSTSFGMGGLAFNGACRSAELVMYTNSTEGWPTTNWLVGHTNETSLDMVPFEGNFSRSSRVWYVAGGSATARLSVGFDEDVYLRPEIAWNNAGADVKHLLLYSATREYNWTILAMIDATNARPAVFSGIAVRSGYIVYGVTEPITPPTEPIAPVASPLEPVAVPLQPVAVPVEEPEVPVTVAVPIELITAPIVSAATLVVNSMVFFVVSIISCL